MTSDTTEASDSLLVLVIDLWSKRTGCILAPGFCWEHVLAFLLHLHRESVCMYFPVTKAPLLSLRKTGETLAGCGQHCTEEIAFLSTQFWWTEKT